MLDRKRYLGDGVYSEWDGYYIVLTTNNGNSDTNTIALASEVLEKLDKFKKDIITHINKTNAIDHSVNSG